MGHGIIVEVGSVPLGIDDFIVLGTLARSHSRTGQGGQQDHLALQQFFLLLQLGAAYLFSLFQFRHAGFQAFSFVALALLEELANLLGTLVLLHQVVIQALFKCTVIGV